MTKPKSIKATDAHLACAHEAADASARIIHDAFRNVAHDLKADASPVTQADIAAEAAIRKVIAAHFPAHGIMGEEGDAVNRDAEYQWILDPIDGTRAFACGHYSFGTLIGLKYKDNMLLGLLNQPITDERWVGENDAASHNGKAISSSSLTHLAGAKIASTSPYLFSDAERKQVDTLMQACAIQQWGGDCINYALVASGHIDIVVEAGLKPYDIMPLLPIIAGSGAVYSDWKGQKINIDAQSCNIIVSANDALHAHALAILRG